MCIKMERRGSLAKEGGEDGRLEGGGEAGGCAAGGEEASAAEGEGEAQGDSRYIFGFTVHGTCFVCSFEVCANKVVN